MNKSRISVAFSFAIASLSIMTVPATAQDQPTSDEVRATILKAAEFYRENVAKHGGYVYFYSTDLKQRFGEGVATADQAWVQPPGTPTVGMAYLKAYHATGDQYYLDAAREAGEALEYGQLSSGGWTNSIDLKGLYDGYRYSGGKKRAEGTTSLDDGQSQSAIRFMVLLDGALEFKDKNIHACATSSLDALLAAQFPNGAFPQGWKQPVEKHPVMKANYPKYDWRTEGRIKNYWDMYTLNDNVTGYVADALIDAHRVYGDDKYMNSLKKLGDFLLLAQMPEPQPAWAQQYNYDMQPIWARKFEPPGVSGDESQEVIETLMKIAVTTRDKKYLEPIPTAINYLRKSTLKDGTLARYYELETNKPLYMFREGKTYTLTYDDSRLPKHYGWKTPSRLDQLEADYKTVMTTGKLATKPNDDSKPDIADIVRSLDEQGRWISVYAGEPLVGQPKFPLKMEYISSEVFSRNMETLSAYLLESRKN